MRQYINDLDFWGFTTSLLCAVHCALLPILLSFGLLGSSMVWLNHPGFELTVAVLTIYFVYQSLIKGYFAGKVSPLSFVMAVSGLILVLTHHFLGAYATPSVVIGGGTIAASHLNNMYFYKKNGAL